MEEPRFVKTMQELREEFVKQRFEEGQVFANRDIESQIAGEDWSKGTVEEALLKLMNTPAFAAHLFAEGQKKVFVKYMPELEKEELMKSYLFKEDPELKEMLLNLYDCQMFFPGGQGYIALGEKIYSPHVVNGHEYHFWPQRNEWLLEAILKYSLEKDINIIGKLIAPLRECVALERKKAEADFDSAVAVSMDGKNIVCAEEVYIFWTNSLNKVNAVLKFPGESFAANKIKLVAYKKYTERDRTVQAWVDDAVNNGQVLDRQDEKGKKYFITNGKHCPSPLPAGGKYVNMSM